ncbi:signal peptidase I [Allochromatium warmingii]|uniref:Signal peptidase I n=1 Tax=Allochromatium warmingii TaxID=61595 RepID=A0A1H3E332_ALLWA|nr:signal peptidase I [Allochromatium warmingii]SDX73037.1 signal peptidase I [Allochromatium warmingii]
MTFDFPAFLVLASFLTGGIWLLDVLVFARRRRAAAITKEPLIVEYARSFFPVIFAVLILRSFLVEPFRIPSNSMMPTLLTGDFILVNKFSYGLRLPVVNLKFLEVGSPQRGDVVVFKFPLDMRTDFIKRVVGVPGDIIGYRNKTIFVNGEPINQLPIGSYTGVGSGREMTGAHEALEQLGAAEHGILTRPTAPDLPFNCQALASGPVTVPEGRYFVMGDNRDNSNDSRCWGFVPDANLVGKAFAIWMHWDGAREGFPIAWSRLWDGIK